MRSRPPQAPELPEPPARLWRPAEPKRGYDVVIVGAGGHGLATAYYLAQEHGIRDVAVLERGWLAGGNMARNTTIIRSNYLLDESAALYGHALDLWERWPTELDHDFLLSQRGVLNLVHTEQEIRDARRRVFANGLNGIDAEFVGPEEIAELCPVLDVSPHKRYPVRGATWQPRAGIAKHDHVAWALARRADQLGVDLIENCEVTGFVMDGARVAGVRTSRGDIAAGRVGLAAAGRTSALTETLGLRLPLQSHPLQAMVSELLEQVHPCVVMSNHVHVYCSQAHKGELVLGAGIDTYNGYGQRGSVHVLEQQLAAAVELFPMFARAHVIRTWAGVVDVTPDASPIIGPTPVEGLFVNCGWGTGGFKATPAVGRVFAHTVATGAPHPLNEPYGLERFRTGALIDEHGAAAVAH
ncbi:MAG: sarcosine oxidase subunit beta family protein [Saccharopolyspora sp.]|uniref:sarcosine oxidase subunit beta family protein n=1 Tax=Saccharopolyspora sp. TaxID=33915 RepID=UPI0025D0BD35|nr:sarcosine oxidase subunit beta family protein [Saccharopolyspora sp.]MBQ6640506.1 sarcosine oxidase subunit beta family protein [Saccharopolyspora sp.]